MRRHPYALGALTLSLVASIGIEVRRPGTGNEPVAQASGVASPVMVSSASRSPAFLDRHSVEWTAVALARPLFSEDRRPPSLAPSGAATPPSLPRLTGTLIGPFGKRAFLVDVGSDKPRALSESDRVGRWTVESISDGVVTLNGPDGVQNLRLSFKAPLQADQAIQAIQASNAAPRTRRHSRT